MKCRLVRLIACCCAVFSTRAACAHDFWIEPSTFRPAVGQTMTAALRVGQDFVGDAVPRSSQLMDSFIVRDPAGERTVDGFENQDPAGYLRVENQVTRQVNLAFAADPREARRGQAPNKSE